MLTTFDADEYVLRALRAGASGFLLKDTPPADIVRADPARRRRRGDAVARRHPAAHRPRRRRPAPRPAAPERAGPARPAHRARARGRRGDRAAAAPTPRSARELFMSVATVKAHVTRLLTKLELDNRVQVALLAHDAGGSTATRCARPSTRRRRPRSGSRRRSCSSTPRRWISRRAASSCSTASAATRGSRSSCPRRTSRSSSDRPPRSGRRSPRSLAAVSTSRQESPGTSCSPEPGCTRSRRRRASSTPARATTAPSPSTGAWRRGSSCAPCRSMSRSAARGGRWRSTTRCAPTCPSSARWRPTPFHGGRDTGLASARPPVNGLLPRQGIPPALGSWDELAAALAWIGDPSRWWWELRPHPQHGTLEVRVPDTQATVADTAAVAASPSRSRCDSRSASTTARRCPCTRPGASRSRRRAYGDGVEGTLRDLGTGVIVPARARLHALIDELEPTAERLGCAAELRPRDGSWSATARWSSARRATRDGDRVAGRPLPRRVDRPIASGACRSLSTRSCARPTRSASAPPTSCATRPARAGSRSRSSTSA